MNCPSCKAQNSEQATVCVRCSAPLLRLPASGTASFYGERRQLTALFCDIVGSTELTSALDPEEYQAIIRAFAGCCRGDVDRFGGYVAEMRGDGALVFFGYPQARGDEPERAIRVALHIIDALGKIPLPPAQPLRVRIGIATGLMAIDVGASHEPSIVGDALHLAMRLQGLAEPNAIVISDLTRQLAGGLFVLTNLGLHQAKGFAQPVPAWHVVGPKKLASQFDALHLRGLSNFVGREREMARLVGCWDRAKRGNGQIVTVSGKAGIGKSRLTKQLRDTVAHEGRVFEYFGSEYHSNTAFHPIIEQVARSSGAGIEESAEARTEALRKMLERIAGDYQAHLLGHAGAAQAEDVRRDPVVARSGIAEEAAAPGDRGCALDRSDLARSHAGHCRSDRNDSRDGGPQLPSAVQPGAGRSPDHPYRARPAEAR
jgi:class 3 adenylate cyclase